MVLANLLETCNFKKFWEELGNCGELIVGLTGFEDSIRKFVSHVINTTYQTIEVPVLKELLGNINGTWNSFLSFISKNVFLFSIDVSSNIFCFSDLEYHQLSS